MKTLLHTPAEGKCSTRFFFVTLALFVALIFLANSYASAQCDTFYNAEAANQIDHTFPYPLNIRGLVFTDIDNDGDLDCYVLNNGAAFIPLQNKGTARHPLFDATTLEPFFIYPYSTYESWNTRDLEFADVDGDGDKDIFLAQTFNFSHGTSTNVYDTAFRYYQNTGTQEAAVFAENEAANPLPALLADSVGGGFFTFYDIDKDGDIDYTYSPYQGYGYSIYLNTGGKMGPHFTFYTTLPTTSFGKPQYFDWNGDGLPDLLIGARLYLNKGTLASPLFTPAPSSPVFTNGIPYIITDVNGDHQPEAYTFDGYMSTVAPVPVIDTAVQKWGDRSFIKYYSNQTAPGYTYNWIYNGKPIAGYHKPFIFAEKQGAYSLEITNTCGTGISLPHFTYNRYQAPPLFTGNSNRQDIASVPAIRTGEVVVKAYPNPFTSGFTVQLPHTSGKQSTLRITDLTGRVWLTQTTKSYSITTGRSLPAGTYLLQVWQGNNCIYRSTLLKQ